jgi:uncharacterized protein (TIGR00369 family)
MTLIPFPPKDDNNCFGCGGGNNHGLKLSFIWDSEKEITTATYTPQIEYSGGHNILHGGIIATILDEACSKILSGMKKTGMTRNINIDYLKPIEIGKDIKIKAWCEKIVRHKYFLKSEILNRDDEVCATASALFMVLKF